jgi:flagellar FliJ protein
MARAFRLAGLLRLRQVQQEQAASDLASANARAHANAMQQNRARAALGGVSAEPTSSVVLYAIAAARSSSRSMLAELEAVEFRTRAQVDEAAASYAEARTRSLGLEKLEARHAATEADADLAAQQAAVDEISSTAIHRAKGGDTQ